MLCPGSLGGTWASWNVEVLESTTMSTDVKILQLAAVTRDTSNVALNHNCLVSCQRHLQSFCDKFQAFKMIRLLLT